MLVVNNHRNNFRRFERLSNPDGPVVKEADVRVCAEILIDFQTALIGSRFGNAGTRSDSVHCLAALVVVKRDSVFCDGAALGLSEPQVETRQVITNTR
jgi:hypothetical protein